MTKAAIAPHNVDHLSKELENALSEIIEQEELSDEDANVIRKFLVLNDVHRVAKELGFTQPKVQKVLEKGHVQKYLKKVVKDSMTIGPLRMARIFQRLEDIAMADITQVVRYNEDTNKFVLRSNIPEWATGAIRSMKVNTMGSVEVVMEDRNAALEKMLELVKLTLGVQTNSGVEVNIFNNPGNQRDESERKARELNARFKSVMNPEDVEVIVEEDSE